MVSAPLRAAARTRAVSAARSPELAGVRNRRVVLAHQAAALGGPRHHLAVDAGPAGFEPVPRPGALQRLLEPLHDLGLRGPVVEEAPSGARVEDPALDAGRSEAALGRGGGPGDHGDGAGSHVLLLAHHAQHASLGD